MMGYGLQRAPRSPTGTVKGRQIGAAWPDQDFALTDRLCFAAMERERNLRAWSYDTDFAIIRLGPGRRRALDIVR